MQYKLTHIDDKLAIIDTGNQFKPLSIDFLQGKSQHRREFGGGRGQLIAKAIGIKKLDCPTVLDLGAGMGQDAFVLACLNCNVTMLERSPMIVALLQDALQRLFKDPDQQTLNLNLIEINARDYLTQCVDKPDVIYFDPMYPDTKNTALPKKEMRILRALAGDDDDAQEVFALALQKAKYRVVVKRPRHGILISERQPDVVFEGKSSRFDVYITRNDTV